MTIEEKMKIMLEVNGLFPEEADEVISKMKDTVIYHDLTVWESDINKHSEEELTILWEDVKKFTLRCGLRKIDQNLGIDQCLKNRRQK